MLSIRGSSQKLYNRIILHTWRPESSQEPLYTRLMDVCGRTWDLGLTAFGGPPVHFQIFHARFVEGQGGKDKWVNEQTYQELFAISQGLPGPASTKMLFCLALLRGGYIPAIVTLALWCLPGAVGMFILSIGVQKMSQTLPDPVYALLSGLNASVVGVFALAGVQLAHKAIVDKLSRLLVLLGACAGLCYSALWFFPVLIVVGGVTTIVWDGWLKSQMRRLRSAWRSRNHQAEQRETQDNGFQESIRLEESTPPTNYTMRPRRGGSSLQVSEQGAAQTREPDELNQAPADTRQGRGNVWSGIIILSLFTASFIAIIVARSQLSSPPLLLDFVANMYLAGTVIFGGGPVVMPLLRSYVVDPGWVSSRDFLIGLAIIQAFPGPNLNFAIFLGALTVQDSEIPQVIGGLLGGIAIFSPGIILATGIQGFWHILRKKKPVTDFLRGVNATAIGFIFTAVYRLWKIGFLSSDHSSGQSLENEPWWVVVAAVTYTEVAWFRVPPAMAILVGAGLGICWYGVVRN